MGLISLEDVIEELIQEEISDETDGGTGEIFQIFSLIFQILV